MKRFLILCAIIACVLFSFCGCGSDKSKVSDKKTSKTELPETIDKKENKDTTSDELMEQDPEEMAIYNELFKIGNKVTIDIDISDEELAKIEADYATYESKGSKSPIYRMADKVTITIGDKVYEIEEVGVRMKGNTSRTSFYDDTKGIKALINLRLSFDETFDDEVYYGADAKVWADDSERDARKKRTFAALNSLELKWNTCYDQTYSRELYAHKMYNAYDVLAANMNLSSINFAGVHCGVYMMYEPIDNNFLEKNLQQKDLGGDLYKCAYANGAPASLSLTSTYGVSDADSSKEYCYDLKTNKKTSTHETLQKLINVINKSGLTSEEFDSVVDKDNFINFCAAAYFAANPDDMRYNHNNYYVYFLKSSGKAVFIPYDADRVLGVTYNLNPNKDAMTTSDPYSIKGPIKWIRETNPVFTTSICKGGFYVEDYRQKLIEIMDGEWMKYDNFLTYYEPLKAAYESEAAVEKDFISANNAKFVFSTERNELLASPYNVSVDVFMEKIVENARTKIDDYK